MSNKKTVCDCCNLPKTPIIYLRMSRKLCTGCWYNEKQTLKSLIRKVRPVADRTAPLGYNFIVNDWFSDQAKGRRYADYVFTKLTASLS